ncbi:MAG: SGNH/GDSL hydrolase family protein, partial [Bdellovibrionales bacterium]|nr:SGNH/GDSL hydrolase family protein [Bdellovibrionales bacterium]
MLNREQDHSMGIHRRLKAIVLGLAFTFLLCEIGLRVVGFCGAGGDRTQVGDSPGDVVMFIGNSHTLGTGAPRGRSFPDQLFERLQHRFSDQEKSVPFKFVNVSRGNANTTFVYEELLKVLKQHKPAYAVVMVGEPNLWNHYGYSQFAGEKDQKKMEYWYSIYDKLYFFRTFRFLQIFHSQVVQPRSVGQGDFFSNMNEDEKGLYWTAALQEANMFEPENMSEHERAAAEKALAIFLTRHPSHVAALNAMSEVIGEYIGDERHRSRD